MPFADTWKWLAAIKTASQQIACGNARKKESSHDFVEELVVVPGAVGATRAKVGQSADHIFWRPKFFRFLRRKRKMLVRLFHSEREYLGFATL
jgi:hypothetical protein